MSYKNLSECIHDLERTHQLIRIDEEIDACLEAGAIGRRVCAAKGPALLFTRVKNCSFPMAANLFGTLERTHFLFRHTLKDVENFIRLKGDPHDLLKHPFRYLKIPQVALHLRPKKVSTGPVLKHETDILSLPKLQSWPKDGGAFITLPLVYTEDPSNPGWAHSNLGMYRIQISGNQYSKNKIGLHYQIHRGIGVHHTQAILRGVPLKVNIFVGGPPALAIAAVMPLPEGLPEILFAGVLGGHRLPMVFKKGELPILAEADFCITGTIDPHQLLPEGPFGDHLGYYSLQHDYPVLRVDHVYHRPNAIWPFTTVGRPPQEDTHFGKFIHELTKAIIPTVLPGVCAVHAVDAAGVHPLLLAIGSERYTPYDDPQRPQELLTQANAILGQGQLSLAKFLFIANKQDRPDLDIHDIASFLKHMLERVNWERDLHFQTCTTIDTLDYSGSGLNQGSKVVIAAVGPPRRQLSFKLPETFSLPPGFADPVFALPGILVVSGPPVKKENRGKDEAILSLCDDGKGRSKTFEGIPLIVVVDDSFFATQSLKNFLWVTFTRSDPATNMDGIDSFTENKHWGCRGPLVMDARLKPHHAPPLEEDPQVQKKIEALAAPGKPLHRII